MIKIIGENGCGKCAQAKGIFSQRRINFQYYVLSNLAAEEQEKYFNLAQKANQTSLPIILDDFENITTIENILKENEEN